MYINGLRQLSYNTSRSRCGVGYADSRFAGKRYREPRSLIVAMLLSFIVNAVIFQPWHYVGWEPLLAQFGLLTTFGFCLGSLVVLVPAKAISAMRSR